MPVISNWKITWDPASAAMVFLDYDQEIDAELLFPWEQDHVDRQVVEGEFTEPLPRIHVKGGITFTVFKEHASNDAAYDYVRTHRAAFHALRGLRKTLRIVRQGGANDDKANTMLKSAPGRVYVTDEDKAMTAFTYTFLGPW